MHSRLLQALSLGSILAASVADPSADASSTGSACSISNALEGPLSIRTGGSSIDIPRPKAKLDPTLYDLASYYSKASSAPDTAPAKPGVQFEGVQLSAPCQNLLRELNKPEILQVLEQCKKRRPEDAVLEVNLERISEEVAKCLAFGNDRVDSTYPGGKDASDLDRMLKAVLKECQSNRPWTTEELDKLSDWIAGVLAAVVVGGYLYGRAETEKTKTHEE